MPSIVMGDQGGLGVGAARGGCVGGGRPWGINIKTRNLMNTEAIRWDRQRKQCQTVLGGRFPDAILGPFPALTHSDLSLDNIY